MNTLVVVDDERGFADYVAKVAVAAGYEALVADSATEFRRLMEGAWPSVLLLDLQMPGTDGIELLRELGDQGCESKVVLVSGMDSRVLDSAYRLGTEIGLTMAGKVTKPVRAADLKQVLLRLGSDSSPRPTAEALLNAIDAGRLFLLYQPKVQIRTRRMVGVEALVRWRGDGGRVLPPDAFIPVAEASGVIDRLTAWVVDAALRQAGEWRRKGLDLNVAINLSAENIRDRQLPDRLAGACSASGVPPAAITLELTETASTQDAAVLLEVLGRFRLKGFRLSIDDFGTGYSSVAQLLRLPFSELKIDKSFVSEIGRVHDAEVVAKTLVDMARNLGLVSVAEGVEGEDVADMLGAWGCDTAQGYLFSRPVDPHAIEGMAVAPPWECPVPPLSAV